LLRVHLFSLSYRKPSARTGKVDLHEIIEYAAQLRLDGVDLEARQFESTTPEYLEGLRTHALQKGLEIGYVGVRSDFGCKGAELEAEIMRVKEWIEHAAFLRVPLVRVIGANVPKGETEATVWPRLRSSFAAIVEQGRAHRIRIGLHNHNHGAIPATGQQVLRLLGEIDDPYLLHILDTGQFRGSPGASGQARSDRPAHEELYEHIETALPRAVVMRTKFYRNESGRERWLDYDRIFGLIKRSGFNGPLSIVYEGHEFLGEERALPNAVGELRALCRKFEV